MNTSLPYLNPVELFDLADKPDLVMADLRKAKKRFLMEMEVDWKDDFDYYGQLFTRNDLDRVLEEVAEEEMLAAYITAAKSPGLSAFLAASNTLQPFEEKQLQDPTLKPLLKTYFAPAFDQAYGRAVASGDHQTVKRMSRWAATLTGIRDAALFGAAYRLLDGRVEEIGRVVSAFLVSAASPEGRKLKGMKIFKDNLPAGILAHLPPYFKDIFNKLTGLVIPAIITLNNDHNNPRMALALANKLNGLPHLSPANTDELKKLTKLLRGNVSNRATSTGDSGVSPLRVIWLVIVACVMMFRIANCANQSSRSNYNYRVDNRDFYNQYNIDRQRITNDVLKKNALDKFANDLRIRVYQGKPLTTLHWSNRFGSAPKDISLLYTSGAGVLEANRFLKTISGDTIPHQSGRLTDTLGMVQKLRDQIIADQLTAAKELGKAMGMTSGYNSNTGQATSTRLSPNNQEVVVSAERMAPIPDEASGQARPGKPAPPPPVSFRKDDQQNYLGPQARVPDNYLLYPSGAVKNDGRLIKIRGQVDDYELGALIVWRDTLGIRQVKISGAKSIPTTFNVAVGQIDKLLDAYIVYGRKWSKEEMSPWGAKGWFQEVTCYCGPDDHKAFINGKKDYRKNFWMPGSTIDPQKSMTPVAFARGVRRLR